MISKVILSLVILTLLVLSVILFSGVFSVTGESVREFDYTWTTAICEGNECRDFEIWCLDGEAIRIDPISGMVIFSDDFDLDDQRKDREFCE